MRGEEIKKLLEPMARKGKRDYTLSVTAEAYEIITRVAEETGNSRPRVLAFFVREAYALYQEMRSKKDKKEKGDGSDVGGNGEGGK